MIFYHEITLLPGVDITLNFLWEILYQQIHLALVEVKENNGIQNIGVSFPEYDVKKFALGTKLRLFSKNKESLEKTDFKNKLRRIKDYVHLTSIREVPEKHKYLTFNRLQIKFNIECIARRKAKTTKITYEEALIALKKVKRKKIEKPFIHFKSLSNGHSFQLIIEKSEREKAVNIGFSTYGLSSVSTVPDF